MIYFPIVSSSLLYFLPTRVLQLRKKCELALVHVSPEDAWSADCNATLSYTVQEDFLSSTWDWIGLYKVNVYIRSVGHLE